MAVGDTGSRGGDARSEASGQAHAHLEPPGGSSRTKADIGALRDLAKDCATLGTARVELVANQNPDRLVLWVPVALSVGISVYFQWPGEPDAWLVAGIWGVVAAAAIGFGFATQSRSRLLLMLLGALVCVALGFVTSSARTALVDAPVLQKKLPASTIVGRVLSVERRPTGHRLLINVHHISGLEPDATPEKVRFSIARRWAAPQAGDRVSLTAILRPPSGPVAPGAYDFARRLYFQGIGGVGFAISQPKIQATHKIGSDSVSETLSLDGFRLWRRIVREAVIERASQWLDGDTGAVAVALLTGERGMISTEAREDMRASGLAHLLAISGLHVGMIAGLMMATVRIGLALVPRLGLRMNTKKIAALLSLLSIFMYLHLSGATVPTLRAFIMTSIVLLAILVDRKAISIRLVAIGALCVLLIQPETLFGPSFQMSFAAVLALVAVYERLGERWRIWTESAGVARGVSGYLAATALSSVIATLATAPFAAFHFNRVAEYGVLSNLIAVPLMAFWVMPCGFLALILMPFGLEALPLQAMGWGIAMILSTADTISSLPGAALRIPSFPPIALILIVVGGLWLMLWRSKSSPYALGTVAAGVLFALIHSPADILVTAEHNLIGVRDGGGSMIWGEGRRGQFIRDQWARRWGQAPEDIQPIPQQQIRIEHAGQSDRSQNGEMRCDQDGCVLHRSGHTIAFPLTPTALHEDCQRATLVIAPGLLANDCPEPEIVIDRADLLRNGPHAISFSGTAFRLEKTLPSPVHRRPWHPRPGK